MNFHQPIRSWAVVVGFGFALATSFGCSEKPMCNVSGQVKVSGVPLDAGLITFIGEEAPFTTESGGIRQGKYDSIVLPAGNYKVVVKVIALPTGPPENGGSDTTPVPKQNARGKKPLPDEKYESSETSGLMYTAAPGAPEWILDLNARP